MITVKELSKSYDDFLALDKLNCTIESGVIYGLVGSNGSGKSTFLRMLTGVFDSDSGSILIDGEEVYDNPKAKEKFVYISDELYFYGSYNMKDMAGVYKSSYKNFDMERFLELSEAFGLDIKKSISKFSKGMKRQAATVLGLSCKTEYIILDETFDGLDPVMRRLMKKVIYSDVWERNATAIITSHSLRELEDTCDKLALLHKGHLIFEKDINDIHSMLFKVQVAFADSYDVDKFKGIEIQSYKKSGKVATIVATGDPEQAEKIIKEMNPLICEILPLTLDEVFTYEMESKGYAMDVLFNEEGENE